MYRERASRLPGAAVWTSVPAEGDGPGRVLPDGCMDLLWHDGRLLVAGPDTHAYVDGSSARPWSGIRFHPGTAPTLLGVPAHELRDRRVELADVWPAAEVRRATARVHGAHHPARGLEDVALRLAASAGPPDPLLTRLVAALDAGRPVAGTADALGLGARQLHRRSLAAFGYGPKTLARILRMRRALALAHAGVPFAETAARAGYADQPHLSREVRSLTGVALRELVPPPGAAS
ncbi:helix-turn-helix transcriptional regulator [Streptomyces althioticus]|uniref:helix-turn-helix transcriptional regulator n=1 Tax=Streptomyces althioticus TaxID=83380 RepID=UPI0033E6F0FD|nr:helix-turn-helix transcriptional regulator [Streptomyces althioticus]